MALVSINKAAKLAGVSRTTIYRKLNSGKLSKHGEHIDTSELLRVFGELKAVPETKQNTVTPVQVEQDRLLQEKERQIETLQAVIAELRQDKAYLQKQLDSVTLMLEHKPASPDVKKPMPEGVTHTNRERELERKLRELERKEPIILKAIRAWRN